MTDRLRVGLYVNDPKATTLRFARCLQLWGMHFQTVWRDDLTRIGDLGLDVLLLHGGWYGIDRTPGQDQYGDLAQTPGQLARGDAVRAFVRNGGGIVGVCAGAFNVVWMGFIEADISRSTGNGPHTLEVVQPDHPLAAGVIEAAGDHPHRQWKAVPAVRMSGPIFFPKTPESMIFSYDWEHRLGAVLAGDYGAGRAVALSPHPERIDGDLGNDSVPLGPLGPTANLLKNALTWAAGR